MRQAGLAVRGCGKSGVFSTSWVPVYSCTRLVTVPHLQDQRAALLCIFLRVTLYEIFWKIYQPETSCSGFVFK